MRKLGRGEMKRLKIFIKYSETHPDFGGTKSKVRGYLPEDALLAEVEYFDMIKKYPDNQYQNTEIFIAEVENTK